MPVRLQTRVAASGSRAGAQVEAREESRDQDKDSVLLDGNTVSDPSSHLTWTTKSTWNISDKLKRKGFDVNYKIVGDVLKDEGFSLQRNKKYIEKGEAGADRDGQFRYIKTKYELMESTDYTVISVDTRKKEPVGNYKNGGSEYRLKGKPRLVNDHDFIGD